MQTISRLFWLLDHLAMLGLIFAASGVVGDLLLGRIRFESRLERVIFTLGIGLGACALALFALSVCGLLYREAIWALTGLGAAAAIWRLWRERKRIAAIRFRSITGQTGRLGACLAAIALLYWLLLLLTALYPPMQWDSTAYHLVLARQYLNDHQILPHPGVAWPVLPVLNHMLFSWGLTLYDDILAQLIEHSFLMLTALGLYAWGRRQQQALIGAAMAALWLSHSLVLWLGASAYVDVCLSAFTFLGIFALRLAWDGGDKRLWSVGMALLGMAAGAKATGLEMPVFGLLAGLLAWKTARLGFSDLLRAAGAAFIFGAPWYLLIGYFTGNPVWPLFAAFSRSEWSHPSVVGTLWNWTQLGVAKTPLNYFSIPVLLVLQPLKFVPDGYLKLTPLIALFPLAWIVGFWNRSVRWWALWASGILLGWFVTSQQVRMLLPMLPLAGVAILESLAAVLARLRTPRIWQRVIFAGLTVAFLGLGIAACLPELRVKQMVPTTIAERERWLSDRTIGYRAARYINQRAEPGDKAYTIGASWISYHLRMHTTSYEGMLQRQIWPESDVLDDRWAAHFKERGIVWVLINTKSTNNKEPRIPTDISREHSLGPDYHLVFRDAGNLVFRRMSH